MTKGATNKRRAEEEEDGREDDTKGREEALKVKQNKSDENIQPRQ